MILENQFTAILNLLNRTEALNPNCIGRIREIRRTIQDVADTFESVLSPWDSSTSDQTVSIEITEKLIETTAYTIRDYSMEAAKLAIKDFNNENAGALNSQLDSLHMVLISIGLKDLVRDYLMSLDPSTTEIEDQQPVPIVWHVLEHILKPAFDQFCEVSQ